MKTAAKKLFARPWYPFVFSAYPVLALLSVNIGEVQARAGLRPLLFSVAVAAILFLLLRWLVKDSHRAAFVLTLFLALFFSYGHLYNLLLKKYPEVNLTPWMLTGWGISLLLAIWWGTWPKIRFEASASALNVIALGLASVALTQTGLASGTRSAHALGAENAPIEKLVRPSDPPDVYYFILDYYTRADFLKETYDYDNSGFIRALEDRGFYVAKCSQSNYVRTEISLASSLNMMYLQDLDDDFDPKSTARRTLWDSLKHSAVRYNFEQMGYRTVNFATGFAWMELTDADTFVSPPPLSSGLTEFEGLFLQTTLARHLQNLGWLDTDAIMGQNFRDRFNSIFDSMDDLANMPEPTFAYIHVISPHPPFVFDGDGNPTYPPDFWNKQRMYPYDLYKKGYKNQLTFLNKKMLEAIDTLLAESDTPPIIVIQGDHGVWMQPNNKRMWILNAYYLPGHNDKLYPNITPVNTFRIIFNSYFGGNYDILKDRSYFSPVPNLYSFAEIPNKCMP